MTDAAALERGYRRWLRCYPKLFRREHQAEMLAVLVAGAREDQRKPHPAECVDLLRSAVLAHLRPRIARSNRSAFSAIRVLYLGAVLELVTAITVVATIGAVKASVTAATPGVTASTWRAVVSGQIEPTAIAAMVAVFFWLWMAIATGRGYRWPRIAFAAFFALNTYSLVSGVIGGSAAVARTDLGVATVLWVAELATVVLLFRMRQPEGDHITARG